MDLRVLHDIAEYVKMDDMLSLVDEISVRSQQLNCDLTLPLVGEFSSGKTTLINALTDSKKLETATKPTTATIYRIHFGCDRCHAKVLYANREWTEYPDIAELKNDKLGDAVIVDVFDTSSKVPSSTILVDTPGLSSSDPRHRQALVNFLPQSDAILLVTDVNQQLTRSITDFVRTMELAKRPIFLVVTKCDTKSAQDLEQVKSAYTLISPPQADHQKKSQKATIKRQVLQNQYFVGLFLVRPARTFSNRCKSVTRPIAGSV